MLSRALFVVLPLLLLTGLRQEPPSQRSDRDLSGYVERELEGWTVRVHPELAAEDSELGREVLELLEHKLYAVRRVLPAKALEELRGVTLWMSLDYDGVPGGVYHPSRRWLEENGHDTGLARCVQFGNARNFLGWERDQPWMVLHELAHAYHDRVLGKDNARVREVFARAVESGDYEAVLRISGRTERAYGLSNTDEYFAELSEAYFGTNDFYPFVRAELAQHDPDGFALLRELWGE